MSGSGLGWRGLGCVCCASQLLIFKAGVCDFNLLFVTKRSVACPFQKAESNLMQFAGNPSHRHTEGSYSGRSTVG